jgi:hypothetical protein
MKLIHDIINELVDTNISISSALLKTKVLASRLENEALLTWVSKELKGYDSFNELPYYRIFKGHLTGTVIHGNLQYNDKPVATTGLDGEFEEAIKSMNFTQSISSLEILKTENKSGRLENIYNAEITSLIEQNWRNLGNPRLQLINCKISISVNAVIEILSVVRNNLLDFMLKIDSEFGNITEIEELKTKTTEISTIMSQTIINNTGDGNILNTGENSIINAEIKISKGNTDDLIKQLKSIGLNSDDTSELIDVIDEAPDYTNKKFGEKVNFWIQKMVGKALDGTWNIGVGAAGNMLADAVNKYYGISN